VVVSVGGGLRLGTSQGIGRRQPLRGG
jgi:hypothetical protein